MDTNDKSRQAESARPSLDPFHLYNEQATHNDRNFLVDCNESIDTMLVFAGLFSGVITTVVVQTSAMLQEDPQERITQLLSALVNATMDANSPLPAHSTYSPSVTMVAINALLFFSLILSLSAALGAMLVKQWARRYQLQGHISLPRLAARNRLVRHNGLLEWHLPDLILWIPMVLHVALAAFLVAIVLWLRILNQVLFITTIILVAIGATMYFTFAMIPLFATNAPFYWPLSSSLQSLSSFLRTQFRRLRTYPPQVPDSELGPTGASYLLTPDLRAGDPLAKGVETFDSVDMLVIIDLLRQTEAKEEIESALERLRTVKWSGNDIGRTLFENGTIILQRCNEVASSTWYTWAKSNFVRQGMYGRIRRTCRFIEWFYYNLSPTDRSSLKNWPKRNMVLALHRNAEIKAEYLPKRFNALQVSEVLEDLVLAESVLAKLNHVALGPQEHCDRCLIPEPREQQDVRIILRRPEHPNEPAEDQIQSVEFVEALISACVISDADCLLHYVGEENRDKYPALIKASTADYGLTVPPDHQIHNFSYDALAPVLNRLSQTLEDSDSRVLWFKRMDGYTRSEFPYEDHGSSFIEEEIAEANTSGS